MLAPGTRLAAYEVRERLAVGGMGEVYLCRHRLLDRIDAVKILRPHLALDDNFRRRFLREALSAARLRHPHLVTVYTADEIDGQLYLAMEYVPGADLGAILLRHGALDPRRVVGLLGQVADALDAAHRTGLTHRDVKPSNVLVERPDAADEHAYLVDFGLSKSDSGFNQDITMNGQLLGTVAYISPEQLQGLAAGPRSDQYSLACVVFESLTGRLPYAREEQVSVLTAHMSDPVPSACALVPSLPSAVDAVVARAMAKSPAERYDTCSQFVAALATALSAPPNGRASLAAPANGRASLPTPAVPHQTDRPSGDLPRSRRTSGQIVGVAVAGAGAGAGAAGAAAPRASGRARPRDDGPAAEATPTRYCLAVVGGPDGGRVVPLTDGEHVLGRSRGIGDRRESALPPGGVSIALADPHLDDDHLLLRVDGAVLGVSASASASVRVAGQPVDGSAELRPGQLIEAGTSLLEVRETDRLIGHGAAHPEPDAVTLARVVHDDPDAVVRGPQHPHAMSVRLGWRRGRPDSPLTVSLAGLASVALRGDAEPVAPVLRWMLTQLLGLHDARDLSIVAAVSPHDADNLSWLAAAPHARTWTAPIAGAHVVSSADAAVELVVKLRELIELRRLAAAGGPAHRDIAIQPRVLAVLDDRLCGADAEYVSMAGPPLGVHVLRLVAATERAPASCAVCIDINRAGSEVVVQVASRPGESWVGAPDGVSIAYARDITNALR